MTHTDLFTAYAAYCDLDTREVWAGAACDDSASPVVWPPITNMQKFVSANLTRLADGTPILQKLAAKNLEALLNSLSYPQGN